MARPDAGTTVQMGQTSDYNGGAEGESRGNGLGKIDQRESKWSLVLGSSLYPLNFERVFYCVSYTLLICVLAVYYALMNAYVCPFSWLKRKLPWRSNEVGSLLRRPPSVVWVKRVYASLCTGL